MRILLALLASTIGGVALAASPSVGSLLPRGGQRGTEVTLIFQGANLADAQEVLVYYPGITVKKLETPKPNEVKAVVTIAADCRLGEHAFRVRTASGLSDLRTFWVGALPSVEEKEPNNDFATAQAIPLNVTIQGIIQNEDADYFVVDCKKGQRLSVEIEAMRLGTIFFDATVTIYNDRQFELVVADDSYITGQDGGASILIPADGKYTIQVRESAFGGNGASFYRLHVGNFPRPTAVLPSGGKPGETLEVRFLGDPLGEIKQTVTLPKSEINLARLHAQTADGVHPAGIKIRVNDIANIVEAKNANTIEAAMAGAFPCAFHGVIGVAGESDFMKFAAKKGQVLDVAVFARRLGSPLDPVLHVGLLKDGKIVREVAANDDSGGPDAALRFTVPEDGDYYLLVHDHLSGGGPSYFYRVELHAPQPWAGPRLPIVDGNNPANQDRQAWSVPRGGRIAVPMLVRRGDWGGPATLAIDNLPPGIKATIEPVDFGNGLVPVILEAAADAPLAAKLSSVRLVPAQGTAADTERNVVEVGFATGANNRPFQTLPTEHVAVAAVEAAPFSIEVVEPKVPLVLNGSMQLKVIAKRAPGFTAAIRVSPVVVPPGMGINGATEIPANANECLIPINAAPNAPVRKWLLAFSANTTTGTGVVWVGSQLVSLQVAPPVVTLAQQRAAIEQGATGLVVCKITSTPFEGKARATLVGLPPKVTCAPVEFTSGQAELTFTVVTEKGSPPGKHGPFVQVVVMKNGESIFHNAGGGELRIDVPAAPKATTAAAVPPPKPAAPPTAKPLTRLEQLRKEQEEREKAEKTAKPPEAKKP